MTVVTVVMVKTPSLTADEGHTPIAVQHHGRAREVGGANLWSPSMQMRAPERIFMRAKCE